MRRTFSRLSAVVVAFVLTATQARAQQPSDAVKGAWEHIQAAQAAGSAGHWDKALAEYQASNQLAPSVVALEGIANAHYQLRHDDDALATYRQLLAMNPQIPEGMPEVKREWERVKQTSQERIREIEVRRAPPPPKPTDPKEWNLDEPDASKKKPADTDVRTAKNSIFIEGLGNGLVYSLNYERIFESPDIGLRVGASYMSLGASGGGASSNVTWLSFPVVGSLYVGSDNHKLQVGVGVTLVYITASAQSGSLVGSADGLVPMPTGVVGYRYIPAKGGFAFSIGFTPIIVTGNGGGFLPWGGLSLGAVF